MSDVEPDKVWDADKTAVAVAKLLRKIETCAVELHLEALHHAADHDMPGGIPLAMISPGAARQDWDERYEAALDENPNTMFELDDDGNEIGSATNVEAVIKFWERAWREELDQPTGLRWTLSRAVDYLRGQTSTIVSGTVRPHFGQLPIAYIDDLRRLVRAMEVALSAAVAFETGAPCMSDGCEGKPLRRRLDLHPDKDKRGQRDHWTCRTCERSYDEIEYRLAVKQAALREAEVLTATDIEMTYRVPQGSLRAWAAMKRPDGSPLVRKQGRDESGRTLYNVADTLACRDDFPNARQSISV